MDRKGLLKEWVPAALHDLHFEPLPADAEPIAGARSFPELILDRKKKGDKEFSELACEFARRRFSDVEDAWSRGSEWIKYNCSEENEPMHDDIKKILSIWILFEDADRNSKLGGDISHRLRVGRKGSVDLMRNAIMLLDSPLGEYAFRFFFPTQYGHGFDSSYIIGGGELLSKFETGIYGMACKEGVSEWVMKFIKNKFNMHNLAGHVADRLLENPAECAREMKLLLVCFKDREYGDLALSIVLNRKLTRSDEDGDELLFAKLDLLRKLAAAAGEGKSGKQDIQERIYSEFMWGLMDLFTETEGAKSTRYKKLEEIVVEEGTGPSKGVFLERFLDKYESAVACEEAGTVRRLEGAFLAMAEAKPGELLAALEKRISSFEERGLDYYRWDEEKKSRVEDSVRMLKSVVEPSCVPVPGEKKISKGREAASVEVRKGQKDKSKTR